MATKLTVEQMNQLKRYGIKTINYAEAKDELVKQLTDEGLSDMEDEEIDTLLQYREAFPTEESDDTPPAPKNKKAPAAEEEEEEVVAPKKKKAPVEEDDADELAKEVTGKKSDAPKDKKPAAEKAKSTSKGSVGRKPAVGDLFDKNNEEHMALAKKKFAKIFVAKEYQIDGIVGGFTVRYLGKNGKIVILKYSNVRIDGKNITGMLNFKKIKTVDALKAILPEDVAENADIEKVSGRNYVRINEVKIEEFADMFDDTELLAKVLKEAKSIDTKMGVNREKMEASLETDKTATLKKKEPAVEEEEEEVKAPAKKKTAVVEEEEEEVVAPKKKKK